MKKVAIVGVEGSGKTVMLADWTLEWKDPSARRPPEKICEVSFLDFAGEVYRTAFGIGAGESSLAEQAEELKRYVQDADDLIVLINLRDVIVHGIRDRRVQEAMWITNAIFDVALAEAEGHKAPRSAIVLSQADSYADTIKDCGGALGVLRKYLPHVANRYDWLDVFAASAVDKTELDDDGNVVPSEDFNTKGLVPILTWIRGEKVGGGEVPDGGRGATALPGSAIGGRTRLSRPHGSVSHQAGDVRMITLPGGAEMEMIWCPPGEFMMGSSTTEGGRCDDEIHHRVTLTKGFWLGKYPVTQAQWKSVMGNYSSLFTGDFTLTGVPDPFSPAWFGAWIACRCYGNRKKTLSALSAIANHIKGRAGNHIKGRAVLDHRDVRNGIDYLRLVTGVLLKVEPAEQEDTAQLKVADNNWWARLRRWLVAVVRPNVATEKTENYFSVFIGNDASPVGNISWDNCQEFIQKVNAQLNCGARLPTEAEWEYACRAGTKTAYFWGDQLNGDKANCDGNYPLGTEVKGPYVKGLSPVGQYPANPWGLYDMHGNIWEWCSDWYGDYPSREVTDPTGPVSGEDRVLRGGSWFNLAQNCRSANRDRLASCDSDNNIGFRLCCSDV